MANSAAQALREGGFVTIRKALSIFTSVLLVILTFSPVVTNAQDASPASGQQVRIHTVLGETDEPFYDACYQLEGFSNIGCDENRDGIVTFEDVPPGEYSLIQTEELGGLYPIGEPGVDLSNIPIYEDDINDYRVSLIDAGEDTDLGLITRDPETGALLTGACYELVGYSNVGCDENADGVVTFEAIPWGTYTVHQTTAPEGYETMDDYEINLRPFPEALAGPVNIPLIQSDVQGGEQSIQVSVLVIESNTGEPVPRADNCVTFPGMTNTGCDEDIIDGQIDFIGVDPTFGQPTFEIDSLACGLEADNPNDVIMHKYAEHHLALVLHVSVYPSDCVE